MKFLQPISLLLLLTFGALQSCDKNGLCIKGQGERETFTMVDMASFTGIKLDNSANVYLTEGNNTSIEVTAQANIYENLSFDISNNILTISSTRCLGMHKPIDINITMPLFHHLEIDGSGNIETQTTFNSIADLHTEIDGSGNINADCGNITGSLSSDIDGSGNITLTGQANDWTVDIDGSGNLYGFELPVNDAIVDIDGSGNVELTANSILDVSIDGSGNVFYKGNPAITTSINGSGNLINAN